MTSPPPKSPGDYFEQGVRARAEGLPASHNPYGAGTLERQEWSQGWNATFDLDEDDDPASCRIKPIEKLE